MSEVKKRRMLIVDVAPENQTVYQQNPLPREFGLNLDTVAKARQWLTNPHNWFNSETFILKWDGLVPMVCRRRGERLLKEPWDDGLPIVVVAEQIRLRRGGKKEEFNVLEE